MMCVAGRVAHRGVVFKNAMAREAAAHMDVVTMGKTGTLTKVAAEVTDVVAEVIDEGRLLALVAAVERESEHPLAQSIVTEAERRGVPTLRAEDFESIPGHGALATDRKSTRLNSSH